MPAPSNPEESTVTATALPPSPHGLSLKATLTGVVLLTVSTTAALVHFPWIWTSTKNIDSVASQLNAEVMRGTSQEVERIFDNVLSAKQLIEDSFEQGLIDPYDPQQQTAFYLNLLKANQNFTWVQLGYANGDYLGAQRRQDGFFNVIRRQWDEELGQVVQPGSPLAIMQAERQENVQNFFETDNWDESFTKATKTISTYNITATERIKIDESTSEEVYYAPIRPFYKVAAETPNQDAWTDIYVFVTGNAVGIDSSITYDPDPTTDDFVGVVSISFELRQISEYLENLNLAKTGAVFIVNEDKELVASTNPDKLVEAFVGDKKPELKRLGEIDDPFLSIANAGLAAKGLELGEIENLQEFAYRDPQSGEKYYIALKRLERFDEEFSWVIGTVTPEAIFLTEIDRNKRTLLGVVLVLVAVGSIGAVLLSDRAIAQPILAITDAAAAIEAGEFETQILDKPAKRTDELGRLARVFQDMSRQVYAREQRLKQQVQELRIEIDEAKRKKAVKEIAETDFFVELQSKAQAIRQRRSRKPSGDQKA